MIKMIGSCGICGYECGYEVDENENSTEDDCLIKKRSFLLLVVLLVLLGFIYFINMEIQNNKPSQELTREPTKVYITEDETKVYVRHINDTSGAIKDNDKINEFNKIINSRMKCYMFSDSDLIRCTDGFSGVFITYENMTWVDSTYNVTNQTIIHKCYDKREGYLIYNKTEVKTCLLQPDHYIYTKYDLCNVLFFMSGIDETNVINDKYYELKCIFDSVKYSENTTLKSVKIMDIENRIFEVGIDE